MTIVTEAFSMSIQYVVKSWPLGSVWSHTQTQRIEPVPHFCSQRDQMYPSNELFMLQCTWWASP